MPCCYRRCSMWFSIVYLKYAMIDIIWMVAYVYLSILVIPFHMCKFQFQMYYCTLIMPVLNAVPLEAPNIRSIQYWFAVVFLTHREMFPDSKNLLTILCCRWWNIPTLFNLTWGKLIWNCVIICRRLSSDTLYCTRFPQLLIFNATYFSSLLLP